MSAFGNGSPESLIVEVPLCNTPTNVEPAVAMEGARRHGESG